MPHAITDSLKIALAQLNPVVGDLAGNAAKLRKARARGRRRGRRSRRLPRAVHHRLSPRGPRAQAGIRRRRTARRRGAGGGDRRRRARRDRRHHLGRGRQALQLDRAARRRPHPGRAPQGRPAQLRRVRREARVRRQGPMPGPVSFRGVRIGVPICEDIWKEEVCECLQETGSEMLVSPNGSPFDWPKPDQRMNVAVARVTETGLPLLYLNQVGGQDELVFDGASFVLNADAQPRRAAAGLGGGGRVVEMRRTRRGLALRAGRARRARGARVRPPTTPACWACATTSTRTAFPAWSWGSRAASTPRCARPCRSMRWGRARVHCVMLPYRYTSNESLRRRRRLRQGAGRALRHRADLAGGRGLPRHARVDVRGPRARRHRGERAEPRARHRADGDLQQVRRHGGDHRQQERDVGRLRHALRRHERRLQSDQGPLQDGGLPPGALAQRARAQGRQGRRAAW